MNDLVQTSYKVFYKELEVLRVISIVLVVYSSFMHQQIGNIGAFFVIIGYVTMLSLQRHVQQYEDIHMYRRMKRFIRRTTPLASIVIIAVTIYMYVLYSPAQWQAQAKHVIASILYVENWYVVKHAIIDHKTGRISPLQHYAVLALFVQYMLVLLIGAKLLQQLCQHTTLSLRKAAIISIILVGTLSFIASFFMQAGTLSAQVWMFLSGALLVFIKPYIHMRSVLSRFIQIGSLLLLVVVGIMMPKSELFVSEWSIVSVASAVLYVIAIQQRRTLARQTCRILGGVSSYMYAFFLIHWPVLYLYERHASQALTWGEIVALIALTALLAMVCTLVVRYIIRKIITPKQMTAFCVMIAVFMIAVVNML